MASSGGLMRGVAAKAFDYRRHLATKVGANVARYGQRRAVPPSVASAWQGTSPGAGVNSGASV